MCGFFYSFCLQRQIYTICTQFVYVWCHWKSIPNKHKKDVLKKIFLIGKFFRKRASEQWIPLYCSLYHYLCMRKVFDKLHHHGKRRSPAVTGVVRHAKKHHKKYLWGAAWFFWLFKLFSFLIVSVLSYTTIIAANIPSTTSIVIPATTIDIQEGKSIIQFDLSDVDIGNYTNIQNIDLRMNIETQEKTVDIETLRNSITTSIEQPSSTNMLTIQLWATDKDTRTINPENLSWIIDQLQTKNTIAYFLPQENVTIQSGTIFMELEVTEQQQTPSEVSWNEVVLFEWVESNRDTQQEEFQKSAQLQYEKVKKSINTKKDDTFIKDAKTVENIALESEDKKIQVKIPKDTKLKTDKNKDFEGTINQPQEISIDTLSSKPESKWLYAFEVWDPDQSIHFKKEDDASQNIDITIYIDTGTVSSWEYVRIYYSEDQIIWNTLGSSIIQKDEEGRLYVNIQVDHMTTFYIWTDEFSFFLSDATCTNDLSTILRDGKTQWPVYACVQWPNSEVFKALRFSNQDTTDLESKSRDVFNTSYNKFSTFGIDTSNLWGPVMIYAQYAYDENESKTRWTAWDQIIVARQGDFSFYISDDWCDGQTTSAVDQSILYLCTDWTYRDFTTDLRISTVSEKDLINQNWQWWYDTAYEFILSGEGKTTVYVEYKYTTDQEYRSEIVSYPMTIVKTSQSNTVLSWTIANWDSLDVSNKNRIIYSPDNISSLTLNSTDISSTITVSQSTWDGVLSAPSLITAGTKKASQWEIWLAKGFTPTNTYEVWDDVARLSINGTNFTVSLLVTDAAYIGKSLKIYSSQDGITWTDENKTCIVNANKSCTFSTSHLTLFTVGSITRDNLQFINQNFRNASPTTGQIFDAFFGTWWTPSAYTTQWTGTCYPTSLIYRNPGTRWATNLAANTIYILNSGNYIQNGTLTINGNCTAIIWKWNVTIDAIWTIWQTINANTKTGIIIDNIYLNNSWTTNYGILLNSQTINVTLNDIQTSKYLQYGIILQYTTNALINNCQWFTNVVWFYIYSTPSCTINNSQSYDNTSYWIYGGSSSWLVINNTQSYNNGNYWIYGNLLTWLIINNSQIYNNGNYGILFTNTPNIWFNNTKIFKNSTYGQISLSNSNGIYYGKNTAYPSPNVWWLVAWGNNPLWLWWTAGTVSTTDPWFSCDFVTNPINGFGTGLFTTSDCSNLGRVTSRTGKEIVTYNYGNNMFSWQYVLRQIRPVIYSAWSLILSNIPYHGHRFIWEYDDPSWRDKNNAIILFTWETPAEWFNLINTWFYTLRSFIYESNLSSLYLSDRSWADSTSYYPYNSSLIFMVNFDKVEEIWETSTLIKDISPYKNIWTTLWSIIRTGNGKRNGSYVFPTSPLTWLISFPVPTTTHPLNPDYISIFAWVKPGTSSVNKNIVSRMNSSYRVRLNGSSNIMERAYLKSNWAASYCSRVSGLSVPANQRSLVGWTYNGSTYSFYLNTWYGLKSETYGGTTNCTWPLAKTTSAFYLWAARWTTENAADMNMDEIRVYNRAINSTGEIDSIYNSNLSAKADHREYVKNYTWIYSWPYGDYNYTFEYADSDNNWGEIIRDLNKHQTCTRTNWRNNNNFITWWFWTHNPAPTDCDIIAALYSTGTDGSDLTAYTSNWTGRNGECNYTSLSVVHLTGGTNKIPSTLAENTIYVLANWTYIQTSSPAVTYNTCSAIIGQTGDIKIYSSNNISNMLYSKVINTITDNVQVDGYNNGWGGTHTMNSLGFYNDVWTKNASLNNMILQYFTDDGIYFKWSDYNQVTNSKTYSNTIVGIFNAVSNYNIFSGVQIFGNNVGIKIDWSSYTTLTNAQIYSNTWAGIYFQWANNHLTLNNIQTFNNAYGIQTNDVSAKDYITINNSQIYNNTNDGMLLYKTNYFTINNAHIYNNGNNGIYFASTNNNSGILNNIWSYNNSNRPLMSDGWTHRYYWLLNYFDNGINLNQWTFNAWTYATYSTLWRTWGNTSTNWCINCSWISNGFDNLWGWSLFIDTTSYPKCNLRGNNPSRTATGDLSYQYGVSLTGQKTPVTRSNTTLTTSSLPYSGARYVAEINNIGTYTNTQCTCIWHTYRWNNDNFITSSFWNHNPAPDYCDIIDAIYGQGPEEGDFTAYTKYRTTARAWQCNVDNIEVVYKTWWTNTLDAVPSSYKIYVLNSWAYTNAYTISDASLCNFILGSGTVTLRSTATLTSLVGIYGGYGGIDNIITDWWSGNIDYWIRLDTTLNNTIHNVSSLRNLNYGFYLNDTLQTLLQDVFAYNNLDDGIYIKEASHYNEYTTINNGMTYNNSWYGINIYQSPEKLAINNFQIYNNDSGWMAIASSQKTIVNNTNIYNNKGYGIIWNAPNLSTIDVAIYNNSWSINLSWLHYYNTLSIFGNKVNTVSWSIYQWVSTDFTNIYVNNGQLINTGSMSRDYITNPQTNNYLLPFSWTPFTGLIGNKSFSTNQRVNYSYGSGIYTQKTPIQYSWINPTTAGWLIFSWLQFIWSNLVKITGDLSGVPSTTTTPSLSVVWISNSSLVNKYSVFGDIVTSKIWQAKNTSTGIDLITGLSFNKIITQLFDPSWYFAMHFQKQTEIVSLCLSWWDNDNFIDNTFRAQNPTNNNIICAIYGSWTSDQTAYTKTWPSYQGDCSVSNWETVKYASAPETEPLAWMWEYTVYIFPSGTYNLYHDIELKNCVAFISTWATTINGNTYSPILQIFDIIDNININGGGTANNGVVKMLDSTKGNTIHSMDIYNGNYGVYTYNSQNNLIDSNNIYENTYGITLEKSDSSTINSTLSYNNTAIGIRVDWAPYTTINNSQSYNNDWAGIYMLWSPYTSINNTLIYNNLEDGINGESDCEYTTINNTDIFNNGYNGIYHQSNNGIISNIRVYNNGECWYNRSNDVYYYNENHFISNQNGNICSSNFIPWWGSDYPSFWWNDGDIYDEWENYRASYMILSWDYFMNPKNSSDEYLLPMRDSNYSQLIGRQAFNDDLPITYSYGREILRQKQPVLWNTNPTLTTWLTFDTNRYIWWNTIKYDWNLEVDSITNSATMTVVTGTANPSEISGYNLWGSDLTSSYGGIPINTSLQIEFSDTVGDGIKKIITQIYSPIYFATHFEKSTILDTTPPTGTILINTWATYTYNANTTLALSANDDNGVTQMQFSCNNSSWTTPEAYSTSKSFNITNQTAAWCSAWDGTKRVYVRYKDTIGNRSTAIADDIILNTILDCATWWDNNNFITGGFRAGSPTNDNIICALYGSWVGDTTAYTQFWTWRDTTQCSGIQMNVIYTGNLSLATLASNTIYVLTDNISTWNATINLWTCSAIISNQNTGTTFYSTIWLGTNNSMFYLINSSNVIFDNILIDGTSDGNGWTHTWNGNGIHINSNLKNISMNNIMSYNNNGCGVYSLFWPISNHISNSKFFNNTWWIHLWQTQNITIENSQIYNNSYWFLIRNTKNTTIDNSQIYNNNHGILMEEVSGIWMGNSTISNSQIYNNSNLAIRFGWASTGNNLYNNKIYNNLSGIFLDASATNNKYYGTNILFNNGQNIWWTTTNLTTWSSSDYPGIFSNWTLSTVGTMSRDYITNPINANSTYLLPWTGTWAGIRGQKTFTGVLPIRYSYGSGILTQTQPIYYSSTTLKTWWLFDATKYIWSDVIKVTGDLLGIQTRTSWTTLTVTGTSPSTLTNKYSVFWNITAFRIWVTETISTGITLTAGDGTKSIITQLSWTSYFATHFEKDTTLDSTPPTFTFSNSSVNEANPLSLSVTSTNDALSWLPASPYNFSLNWWASRSWWQSSSSFSLWTQNEPTSIPLRVKVRDVLGNESSMTLATWTWNNVLPTATAVSITGSECATITNTANVSDPGGTTFTYQWYANNTCTAPIANTTSTWWLNSSVATTNNYSYTTTDNNGGISSCVAATFAWTNSSITANSFIYWTDIGSTAKTFSWLTLSSAAAWSCETITATVQTQATKWTCSITAWSSNITYTPNTWQSWQDICTIRITDWDSYIDRTVTVNNIYFAPTITNLMFIQDPTQIQWLNITYFGPYIFAATLSGYVISGAVNLSGINGNGGSCIDYYASGSCAVTWWSTSFSYPLIYSGNNIRVKKRIYPDQIYPEIYFADNSITWYTTGSQSRITQSNYTLVHMKNPYIMTGNTTFRIEMSVSSWTNPNVVDLQAYLIKSWTNLSFFTSNDRRTNTWVQLVGAITKSTAYSHTHTQGTVNKSDYLISLAANNDGTIGTNHINISGDFWIALYANTNSTTRGRDLKYYSWTICQNASGRYIGNQGAWRTTTRQSGCPDIHVHITRESTYLDGVKAIVYASYTWWTQVLETSWTSNFYFWTGNLAPNATSFITPTSWTIYTGNIYISRYPANDANLGSLTYNISLLSSTGVTLQTLITATSATGFTWNVNVPDGTYSLSGTVCDSTALCTPFYLNDPFIIQNALPIIYFTWSTPINWTTITGNNFKPQIEMITTGWLATFNYIFSSITYPYYDSWLVLMMNFDNVTALGETAGWSIKDFSQYGNNGSVIGQTIWTGNGRRNGAYIFNGTGTNTFNGEIAIYWITTPQYLSSRGTIAYWINITKKDIGQGIFHLFEDSNPTTKYIRNYISSNNFIDLVIENEDTTELNVTYDLDNLWIIENQWIYIAWTQDGNGVKLYINGQEKTLGGTNTGIRWTDHLTWTKTITIWSARWTFSWAIDELRIYNRALTSWQILQMRRSNFQKYDIDKWRFTDDRQCMWDWTYTYSWYVMNTLWLSATTGRSNLISIINPFVTPASYFIGTTWVSATQTTLTGQFTWYFTVDDRKGTTGRYSTIQLPLTMTWVNYATNKIINNGSNIKFMAAWLAVTWSNTGNIVYINPDLSSYTWFTAPKQYIQRDYSQWYSCPSGIYGNKPHISIDIPGYQNPDTYSGTITIDISN